MHSNNYVCIFIQNFGGYRSGLYIVKTTEGESIVQLLDGYIQLIQQTVSFYYTLKACINV